ncbi:MAG: TolC family protein [Bacteroidia bacterium]|nr:TolC family protein [Bacteroidia bacterium]
MSTKKIFTYTLLALIILIADSCRMPFMGRITENKNVPTTYNNSSDSSNTARIKWKQFFTDPYLAALIDSALQNNQEFAIMLQEINIARNEVRARKGQYLPFINIISGAGLEKVGRYTRQGAVEQNLNIEPGKNFPDPLPDFMLAATATWEVDIWKKLRNARKSAIYRYLSTIEGRNFMVTNLVAGLATAYYELMALDNQLEILKRNIEIQQNALEIVKLEKASAKVTELAVRKFEAEVLKNQSMQFNIMQMITEKENKINFLTGRFPQPVSRNSQIFTSFVFDSIHAGIPSQLLQHRPDIRRAELELRAAKIDVKVARANFYPSLVINAGVGFQSFNPRFLLGTPQSMLYSIAGNLVAPVINRNAIKAYYYSANARQIQDVYNYEQTILRAYIEVANQLSNIQNLQKSYELRDRQVQALTRSIDISTALFKSARADYMEVLMTQRDALESRFELIDTKLKQMHARVNVYQALGGGWE